MEYLGVSFDMKNVPELDPEFIPFGLWAESYLRVLLSLLLSLWKRTRVTFLSTTPRFMALLKWQRLTIAISSGM